MQVRFFFFVIVAFWFYFSWHIKVLENQRIQAALEEQRQQFDQIEKENVNGALDVQKREFELEKERVVSNFFSFLVETLVIQVISRQKM